MMENGTHFEGTTDHAVRFYDNERSLAQLVADFLAEGLAADNPGIVVATASQRAAIVRELVSRSLDVVQLQKSRDLVLLDSADTLAMFMTGDTPDATAFNDTMCEVIKTACRGRSDCTVRIYGQMVDVLWQAGKQQAAVRLEMLWNQLAQGHGFSLMCGYAMGHFYKTVDIEDVCRHHTHVVSADGKWSRVA